MNFLIEKWFPGSTRQQEIGLLEDRLRSQARKIPVSPSDSLHRRIMAGLASKPAVSTRHSSRPYWGVAALATLLAIAALGLWRTSPSPVESRIVSIPDMGALAVPIPTALLGQIGYPLDHEADALKSDVLSAGRYLFELTGI